MTGEHRTGEQSPPPHEPDRPPSRAERRATAARMVTVLGEALSAQITRLAATADPAPEGWWFAAGS